MCIFLMLTVPPLIGGYGRERSYCFLSIATLYNNGDSRTLFSIIRFWKADGARAAAGAATAVAAAEAARIATARATRVQATRGN